MVTPMNGRLKQRILRRDNFRCRFCGATDLALTIDHIMPTSRGGHPEKKANLVTACFKCNQKKANMTPEEAKMPILGPGYTPPGRMLDHKTELTPLTPVNHRRAGRKRRRRIRREYKKEIVRQLLESGELQ